MSTAVLEASGLEPLRRLSRDMAMTSTTLSLDEARYLVDAYYTIQGNRISSNNQVRALEETEEPHSVIAWLAAQDETLESQIKRVLDKWTDAQEVGRWLRSIVGIGPVIAAGIIAHIDIEKATTVSKIWRFAGLDPTCKWEKKQKRPYNAKLKTLLAFKIGESFVKVQGHENDIFGKIYAAHKRWLQERNDAGEFTEEAARILVAKRFNPSTDAYKAYSVGKLPPAHVHARARRYAVKLFVAYLHYHWYKMHFKREPPEPFASAMLQHEHIVDFSKEGQFMPERIKRYA